MGRPQADLAAAPLWVRATAALALAAGLAAGAGLGLAGTANGEDDLGGWSASLAESYWQAVDVDAGAAGEVER
jgi:hypothetical protein